MYELSALSENHTCRLVLVDTGCAGRPAWLTAITSRFVSSSRPYESSLVMSLPMYIGAAETAHSVAAVRRSSLGQTVHLAVADIQGVEIVPATRSGVPPPVGQPSGTSRAMFCQAVSASPGQ